MWAGSASTLVFGYRVQDVVGIGSWEGVLVFGLAAPLTFEIEVGGDATSHRDDDGKLYESCCYPGGIQACMGKKIHAGCYSWWAMPTYCVTSS
jgi:hypothetical protein